MSSDKRFAVAGRRGPGSGWSRRRVLTGGALLVGVGAARAWWAASFPAVLSSTLLPGGTAAARTWRETRPTLDPALFVGKARRAHEVARAMPDLLDQLYCYCRCDKTAGHKSLLSCYTDGHAPTRDICMDEALDASRMAAAGHDIGWIRAEIDRTHGR